MAQAKGVEGGGQGQVDVVAVAVAVVIGKRRARGDDARVAVGIAAAVHLFHEIAAIGVAVGRAQLPVIGEAVRQVHEVRRGLGIQPRPGRIVGHRAVEVGARAVAIEQRKAAAKAIALVALVFHAGGQHRIRRQVGADHAIKRAAARIQETHIAVALAIGGHQARPYPAVVRDGHGDVRIAAHIVPAAHRRIDRGRELAQRTLAHEIHGGRRIARACHQAGGAAHDLHAVVDGRVHIGRAIVPLTQDGRYQAVELEVVDGEAARRERIAVAVAARDGDAGRCRQDGAGVGQALVFDLLPGDHAHGLRRFARRERQARGRAHGIGRVGLGALGGAGDLPAGDADGGQLGHFVVRRPLGGGLRRDEDRA